MVVVDVKCAVDVKDQADTGFKMINATHDDEIKVKRVRYSLDVLSMSCMCRILTGHRHQQQQP